MTASAAAFRHYDVFSADPPGPLVVEIPHAGILVDEASAAFVRVPPRALAMGAFVLDADLGADVVWEGTEALGVTRIVARTSRYVIDLNTDPRPPPQAPYYEEGIQPRMLIRRSQCGMSWPESTPAREVERRIREVVDPYHDEVRHALAQARERHGAALLLSFHTFPDRARAVADVVLGTLDGTTTSAETREAVRAIFREAGLTVAVEKPFPGGYALVRHAKPSEGIGAMQIEIARRVLTGTDAGGLEVLPEAVSRVRGVVEELARYVSSTFGARP
jgi:N-formylglutamate amidohydrolase